MTGTGVVNRNLFTIEPNFLNFGNVQIDQTSDPQFIRIKNIDTENLEIRNIRIVWFHSVFILDPIERNIILEPNEYLYLSVSFAPDFRRVFICNLLIETNRGWTTIYLFGVGDFIVSESDVVDEIPSVTTILGNYPNPFNPFTSIRYQVSGIGNQNVKINVYNVRGQRVRTLVNDYLEAGIHEVVWNGRDDSGQSVGSGVYFYRMVTGENTAVGRMLLLK